MITLNLTAKSTEQELIKKYLEENASETLAEKINNGVRIEKDGKTLINKKTLDGFMKYATGEARKQAEKGASAACVRSDVVFGWAIHYFEEESIEGKLYNEDGTEYKAPKPIVKKTATETTSTYTPPVAKKPESDQLSLFDFTSDTPVITDTEETVEEPYEEVAEEPIEEPTEEIVEEPVEEIVEEPVEENIEEPVIEEEEEIEAEILYDEDGNEICTYDGVVMHYDSDADDKELFGFDVGDDYCDYEPEKDDEDVSHIIDAYVNVLEKLDNGEDVDFNSIVF